MGNGAITSYVDVAQLVLYAFWAFFAGLCYYLIRENHREGYPEMDSGTGRGHITGWPVPEQKTFKLADGHEHVVPKAEPSQANLAAEPAHAWTGAPLVPTGAKPMLDGIGPGAWAERADRPDTDGEGAVRILPLRLVPEFDVARQDRDPRGLPVRGADGVEAGKVVDLWVDTPENLFRYIEVELTGGERKLLPINFANFKRDAVTVKAILGAQFADVPATKHPEQVTMLEEEKICAYYGAGTLYAEPSRQEPLL